MEEPCTGSLYYKVGITETVPPYAEPDTVTLLEA